MARFHVLVAIAFFCCVYAQEEISPQSCQLRSKILADMKETKSKINTLLAKLRTYAMENDLPLANGAHETTPTKSTAPVVFHTCKDIMDFGHTDSGIYEIIVDGFTSPVPVFCDMNIDFGGWTVIQRRIDGSVDFNRTYADYAEGFGMLGGEFWLGNELISALTKSDTMEMRVDMRDVDDVTAFAKYGNFKVDGANKKYRLSVGGEFHGDADNSFSYHQRGHFSTFDVDNDDSPSRSCALRHTGGWWFKNCMRSNLNGLYFPVGPRETYADGIVWSRFRGLKNSMKFTEMKIRPVI